MIRGWSGLPLESDIVRYPGSATNAVKSMPGDSESGKKGWFGWKSWKRDSIRDNPDNWYDPDSASVTGVRSEPTVAMTAMTRELGYACSERKTVGVYPVCNFPKGFDIAAATFENSSSSQLGLIFPSSCSVKTRRKRTRRFSRSNVRKATTFCLRKSLSALCFGGPGRTS